MDPEALQQLSEQLMEWTWILLVVTLVSVAICVVVARRRGASPVFWGVMAALFGPFAVPFVFFARRRRGPDRDAA